MIIIIIINDNNNNNNNQDSQSAHTLRGIQPSTPWAACFWSDTFSAASPCLELPPHCPATAEPSEPGCYHLVGLHRLSCCAEFALSYRGCKLRHTLYGTAECVLVFVRTGKEGSSVCKTFLCPNHSGQKLLSAHKWLETSAVGGFHLIGIGSDYLSRLIGWYLTLPSSAVNEDRFSKFSLKTSHFATPRKISDSLCCLFHLWFEIWYDMIREMLIWYMSTGLSPSTAIRVTDFTAIRCADYVLMFLLGTWRFTTRQKTGNILK